jgi:N-acetylneuraminic acid mutarotase
MNDAPSARNSFCTVWTGSEMIVWGGSGSSGYLNTGARYNPITDSWTTITSSGAPTARFQSSSIWTGTEMIIWGGYNPISDKIFNDGWRYNPTTDSWSQLSAINAPSARYEHTAVWTGSKMIVFGGYVSGEGSVSTGALYDPLTDTWTEIPSGISGRKSHKAIWTGIEMIVWGGEGTGLYEGYLDTGGRFNPVSKSWMPTSRDSPTKRFAHTAVWTGSEMLIWGGFDGGKWSSNDIWIYTPTRKLYLYQRP